MNKQKGISLITLVITIIVMIILAGAIILSLSSSNIFDQANEATVKNNMQTLQQEYDMKIAESQLYNEGNFDKNNINAHWGGTGDEDITKWIPNYKAEYGNKFAIESGKLVYYAVANNMEKTCAEELGLEIKAMPNQSDFTFTYSGTNATVTGLSQQGMDKIADEVTLLAIPDTVTDNNENSYTVTRIENDAFRNCKNLALTSLPANVTSIGSYAFSYCKNLALTSLPANVTSIGVSTFLGCENLALTSLPANATSIGGHAFRDCTNLALTSLPANVTSIGSYAFLGCTAITSLTVPWANGAIANEPWGLAQSKIIHQ